MELYRKILADYYARYGYLEEFVDGTAIVRDRCYQALCQIKAVLEDDRLEDPVCFERIERIVEIFEDFVVTRVCGMTFDSRQPRRKPPGLLLRVEWIYKL